MKLENILEGANDGRGKFTGYKPNGKKDAKYEYFPMDWDLHYSGEETFGISPVKIIQNEKGRKGVCRWIGWDVDLELGPEEICKTIFKLDPQLFCYLSSGGRWHVHLYLDDWMDVEEARKKAVAIEEKLKKIYKKGVDTSHTVPKSWTIEENKPGQWLFMPYSKNKKLKNSSLVCYSPSGNPLTRSQVEFRHKWRKNLLIACSVGTTEGQGGREPFLFRIAQEIKQNNLDLTLEEVNQNFNDVVDERELAGWIRGIEKSLAEPQYTKEYLRDHYDTYLKDINGYWRRSLNGSGALDHLLIDPETEAKQIQFYKDVIYIKLDDRWYDKSTGEEYRQTAIKVTYGSYFDSDVIKNFSNNPDAQLVEKTIYRPDLWKDNEDPIVIDEKGLSQLNNYRPGGVEAMEPDTPEKKKELQMFKDLVRKLTEHEGTGITDDGQEVKLYDYVLDHLSMPFQRRGEKVRSSIIFHSEKFQVGKTTLVKIIRKGLGIDNCTIITPQNAVAREKGFIEHQLVLVDEIKIDGTIDEKKSVMNTLKPLMTEEVQDCRPLFKDWRRVFATTNYILNTNHKDAMALDDDEARYTCIDVGKSRQQLGGGEFYDPLYDAFEYGTLANVVKHFLSKRKISENFVPSDPCLKTNFLKEMSKAGGHPVLPEVEEYFNAGDEPFHQSILVFGEAWDYLKKEKRVKAKSSDFKKALVQLGCERVGECKHKRSNKNLTAYIVKNHEFFADKTKSQIINIYWTPMTAKSNVGDEKFNISAGDMHDLDNGQKELDSFEDFRREDFGEDQKIAFEEIRKARKKKNETT